MGHRPGNHNKPFHLWSFWLEDLRKAGSGFGSPSLSLSLVAGFSRRPCCRPVCLGAQSLASFVGETRCQPASEGFGFAASREVRALVTCMGMVYSLLPNISSGLSSSCQNLVGPKSSSHLVERRRQKRGAPGATSGLWSADAAHLRRALSPRQGLCPLLGLSTAARSCSVVSQRGWCHIWESCRQPRGSRQSIQCSRSLLLHPLVPRRWSRCCYSCWLSPSKQSRKVSPRCHKLMGIITIYPSKLSSLMENLHTPPLTLRCTRAVGGGSWRFHLVPDSEFRVLQAVGKLHIWRPPGLQLLSLLLNLGVLMGAGEASYRKHRGQPRRPSETLRWVEAAVRLQILLPRDPAGVPEEPKGKGGQAETSWDRIMAVRLWPALSVLGTEPQGPGGRCRCRCQGGHQGSGQALQGSPEEDHPLLSLQCGRRSAGCCSRCRSSSPHCVAGRWFLGLEGAPCCLPLPAVLLNGERKQSSPPGSRWILKRRHLRRETDRRRLLRGWEKEGGGSRGVVRESA